MSFSKILASSLSSSTFSSRYTLALMFMFTLTNSELQAYSLP